jgi:hypothetical protein
MANCLAQGGDAYEWYGRRRQWSQVGDWLYALEGLVGPGYRQAAAGFMRQCADGLGHLPAMGRALAEQAGAAYAQAGEAMGIFAQSFAEIGPVEEYDERVATLQQALGSQTYRRRAADLVEEVRRAEAEALTYLARIIETINDQVAYG